MRIPPFTRNDHRLQSKETDFGTEAGCKILCGIIVNAWRKAGYMNVMAHPERITVRPVKGKELVRFQVRTNLINGLPPWGGA